MKFAVFFCRIAQIQHHTNTAYGKNDGHYCYNMCNDDDKDDNDQHKHTMHVRFIAGPSRGRPTNLQLIFNK